MRFMMLIQSDAAAEAGVLPGQELLADMTRFQEEMREAGVLLSSEALHATAKGVRVSIYDAGRRCRVTDGPFSEAKEVIAGYWVLRVASKAEAIAWAKRVPCPPEVSSGAIELRELFEPEAFGGEPAQALRLAATPAPSEPGSRRYA